MEEELLDDEELEDELLDDELDEDELLLDELLELDEEVSPPGPPHAPKNPTHKSAASAESLFMINLLNGDYFLCDPKHHKLGLYTQI